MFRIFDAIARDFPALPIQSELDGEISDSRLMAELANYVVDTFELGDSQAAHKAFEFAESLIVDGRDEEVNAAVIGFLETVQNVASHRKCGSDAFETFLGPSSRDQWAILNETWKGKTSLAEVVAVETGASLKSRWWHFWKKRDKRSPRQLLSQVENPELRKLIEQITREE